MPRSIPIPIPYTYIYLYPLHIPYACTYTYTLYIYPIPRSKPIPIPYTYIIIPISFTYTLCLYIYLYLYLNPIPGTAKMASWVLVSASDNFKQLWSRLLCYTVSYQLCAVQSKMNTTTPVHQSTLFSRRAINFINKISTSPVAFFGTALLPC